MIQTTSYRSASSNTATTICVLSGGELSNYTRDRLSSGEGGSSTTPITARGRVCKQYLPGTKERREVEINPEFEVCQSVRHPRTFQDGGHSLCERPPKQRRLYVQTGPQGRISFNPNSAVIQEVPDVQLAREVVRVHSPPLWTFCGSKGVYESIETGISHSPGNGNPFNCLPGRFSNHWEEQIGGRTGLSENEVLDGESGVHSERRQITEQSYPVNRISGIRDRFTGHDVQTSTYTCETDQGEMQGSLGEWSEDSPGIGPYSGSAGGHTTGNIASTTALQSVAVSEERRDPPPLIRYDSDSESSQPEGSTMVDEQFEPSEWETDSHASPRHSDQIGCVQHRLGSLLQGHKDERSVVQGRSHSPYQLQRDVGSISCTTVVCEGYTRSPCQTPDRQHDDGVLYQPYGGHTLSPVNEHDITDLVMVPGQEAAFDSGASTWPLESGGGSGVSSEWKLNPAVFRALMAQLGPCTVDLFASRLTAQLEMYMSWKPDPGAVATDALSQQWTCLRGYAFPPFSLIGRCLTKVRQEKVSRLVLIAPMWPTQPWFPVLQSMAVREPVMIPQTPDLLLNHRGEVHPLITQGSLNLAAWLVSGNPLTVKEFQIQQQTLFWLHGEPTPSNHIHPVGENGKSGVPRMASVP